MKTHWHSKAPQAPFWAVIFVSKRSKVDEGYQETDAQMMEQASRQQGFLGYSSAGEAAGGIFISYWRDEESIARWREHAGHVQAKSKATRWYDYFHTLICEVRSHREFESQWLNGKN